MKKSLWVRNFPSGIVLIRLGGKWYLTLLNPAKQPYLNAIVWLIWCQFWVGCSLHMLHKCTLHSWSGTYPKTLYNVPKNLSRCTKKPPNSPKYTTFCRKRNSNSVPKTLLDVYTTKICREKKIKENQFL